MRKEEGGDGVTAEDEGDDEDEGLEDEYEESLSDHKDSDTDDSEETPEVSYIPVSDGDGHSRGSGGVIHVDFHV